MPSDSPVVLVVDDELEVADIYALRLDSEYETRVAYGGEEALEAIDDDVAVVLLDRRMPDISGDDVLSVIRERGYDCRVIMLTAVDPGPDIVEMAFDDYLCKPVEKHDLVAAIEQQLAVAHADERVTEYLELRAKRSLLSQEQLPEDDLAAIQGRVEQLREQLSDELDADELAAIEETFEGIVRHS